MNNTTSGTLISHNDVYEWWRSRKNEINNSIDTLKELSNVEPEVLDIMKELLNSIKIKTKMSDYVNDDDE